jgi:dipeptidyl aminopeptidase/acylaminoacyl peptidase
MKSILFKLLFLLFVFQGLAFSQQNLSVKQIMAEPSIAGMRAESEKLSPDGQKVIFSWNAEGKEPRNLYIWAGGEPNILVDAEQNYEQKEEKPESKLNYGLIVRDDFAKSREKNLFGVEFSPDSKRILFLQNSDIYVLDLELKDAKPRRITRTQGSENSARWLTNESILYSSNGNYFVLNLKETSIIQVTKEANPTAFVGIGNVAASKDGKMLAYVVSDTSKQRALFVPNYLDEFTTAPTFRRGWSEQKILVSPTDGSREKPFEINLPKAEGVSLFRVVKWSADNKSLIIDRNDKDTKRRQLFYIKDVGSKAEQTILVTEETDEKWIAPLSTIIEPNPNDDSKILFASEKDGFNHLYLATLERRKPEPNPNNVIRQENIDDAGFTSKVEIKQLTNGKFEVDWAKWSNEAQFIFSSTKNSTAEREFAQFDINSNKNQVVYGGEKGMRTNPQIIDVPSSKPILLYNFSTWNKPSELYIQTVCVDCRSLNAPQKISNTTPQSFLQTKWNEPKFIDIPTRDGKFIKSKVYLPNNFGEDSSKRLYPMVIFVHGAGYLQNTINGWNNYHREFMFNQMLTQKGYVVLDIDFRGSAGYGRDWRTDVYDFLGGKDYDDHLDAIDFAVKNYAVNPKKIGVYGGSYGGFMAEMLAFRTDKINCAAALRPVADWKNYYASSPVYTAQRLGFPDKNVEGYKRSSPINYAEKLDKPLLILHGLVDDNVHAQDSMQLIEKLIRLEKTKYFESQFYPTENHGFQRPTSWTDEYERILSFFEKNLK